MMNKLNQLKWQDGSQEDKEEVSRSNEAFFEQRRQAWAASTQSKKDGVVVGLTVDNPSIFNEGWDHVSHTFPNRTN